MLSNSDYSGAISVWRRDIFTKYHKIAEVLQVSYGGRQSHSRHCGMAGMAEITLFFLNEKEKGTEAHPGPTENKGF